MHFIRPPQTMSPPPALRDSHEEPVPPKAIPNIPPPPFLFGTELDGSTPPFDLPKAHAPLRLTDPLTNLPRPFAPVVLAKADSEPIRIVDPSTKKPVIFVAQNTVGSSDTVGRERSGSKSWADILESARAVGGNSPVEFGGFGGEKNQKIPVLEQVRE